jgi:hypothetical protein
MDVAAGAAAAGAAKAGGAGGGAAANGFPQTTDAPSRGALTADFLAGGAAPLDYLRVGPGAAGRGRVGLPCACNKAGHRSAVVCGRDACRAPPCPVPPYFRPPHLRPPQGLPPGYMGVNVAVGDLRAGRAAYWSNRDGRPPREVPPGFHGEPARRRAPRRVPPPA